MITKAIVCDVCGKVEPMNGKDVQAIYDFALVPQGWVRFVVNNPRRYSFAQSPSYVAIEELDVCSISCLNSRIWSYEEATSE